MMIDWKRIINVGVEKDFPITLKMNHKIPADIALDMILKQASANNELDPIWHHETESHIAISTQRQILRTNTYFRSYDIRDIASDADQHIVNHPKDKLAPDEIKNRSANSILDLIRSQIAPKTWTEVGENASSIRELNGLLLLRAHESIHKQVAQLLSVLRTISIPVPEMRASRPLQRLDDRRSSAIGYEDASCSRRGTIDRTPRKSAK